MHKLEPLYHFVVYEKTNNAIECSNIYCLEVLLDCHLLIGVKHLKAEEKFE